MKTYKKWRSENYEKCYTTNNAGLIEIYIDEVVGPYIMKATHPLRSIPDSLLPGRVITYDADCPDCKKFLADMDAEAAAHLATKARLNTTEQGRAAARKRTEEVEKSRAAWRKRAEEVEKKLSNERVKLNVVTLERDVLRAELDDALERLDKTLDDTINPPILVLRAREGEFYNIKAMKATIERLREERDNAVEELEDVNDRWFPW